MIFASVATATPTQLRLHQERKERLARLSGRPAAVRRTPSALPPPPLPAKPLVSGWFPYYRAAPYDSWDCSAPPAAPPASTWRGIAAQVCAKHEVAFREVMGQARSRRVVIARQEIFYRLREERQISWSQIGKLLGGKDHTTVLHGYRMHKATLGAERAAE